MNFLLTKRIILNNLSVVIFFRKVCPCGRPPAMESCVEVPMTAFENYCISIKDHLQKNPHFMDELNPRNESNHLTKLIGIPENSIERTTCGLNIFKDLEYGVGSHIVKPKVINISCVNGCCDTCGIENVFRQKDLDTITLDNTMPSCIVWKDVPRPSGKNQFELTEVKMKFHINLMNLFIKKNYADIIMK